MATNMEKRLELSLQGIENQTHSKILQDFIAHASTECFQR
jgi:hypothetical protein